MRPNDFSSIGRSKSYHKKAETPFSYIK